MPHCLLLLRCEFLLGASSIKTNMLAPFKTDWIPFLVHLEKPFSTMSRPHDPMTTITLPGRLKSHFQSRLQSIVFLASTKLYRRSYRHKGLPLHLTRSLRSSPMTIRSNKYRTVQIPLSRYWRRSISF
ncbi:hypothetical protein EV401DRAFT_1623755 [Pisolithus croceorrhizus]|nr:hypothetical protein EV401DRAFT_1623755 [Pisolithus croceorrhizus]